MKYFLSITSLFLASAILGSLSCSPLMEKGGFVDAQATVNSEVGNETPASPSAQDGNNDSSTDTDVSSPVGPEDVEEVLEEGDPPPTRIF